uniref:Uncharacterized protein n=1 Tax=Globodera pallida TaxID=36090 RepID=A0A183C0B6_GLOPA
MQSKSLISCVGGVLAKPGSSDMLRRPAGINRSSAPHGTRWLQIGLKPSKLGAKTQRERIDLPGTVGAVAAVDQNVAVVAEAAASVDGCNAEAVVAANGGAVRPLKAREIRLKDALKQRAGLPECTGDVEAAAEVVGAGRKDEEAAAADVAE